MKKGHNGNSNLEKAVNKAKKALKNSTSNDTVSNRTSAANPFIFEKNIKIWITDEGQLYLESWANDGLSNVEIAKKMGIGEDTFYRWCKEEPSIKSAVTRGRDTSTMAVENMLYKCAMGFKYTEQQVTKDGDIVEVERYYEPSQEAQKFILTNRRRDKWKSKQEVALEAQVQAQAQVQATTKVVTAEDVARSIIGADETQEEEFDFPDIPDEIDNGA